MVKRESPARFFYSLSKGSDDKELQVWGFPRGMFLPFLKVPIVLFFFAGKWRFGVAISHWSVFVGVPEYDLCFML